MEIGATHNYSAYIVGALPQWDYNGGGTTTDSYDGYADGYEVEFSPQAAEALSGG